MTLRRALALSPILFAFAAAAPACGARSATGLDTTDASGGGGAGTGGGATSSSSSTTTSSSSSTSTSSSSSTTSSSSSSGAGGTGGGASHPVISDSPGSFMQAETSVIAGPNGTVAVAWIDVDAQSNSNIGYTFSTDDGATFAPPSLIFTPGNRVASDPVLAVDPAGNIYVTWVGFKVSFNGTPSSMRIYVSIAPAGSTAFGDPIQVSPLNDDEALYDKPWITVTNKGTIVVTYQRDAMPSEFGLVATRSTDGGKSWQQSFIVDEPDGSVFRNLAFPCAPKTGDHLWATFLAFDNFGLKAKLARSDDDGATWQPEITVSQPNESVAFDDPNCIAEGEQVWVSYGLSKDPLDQMAGETQKLSSIQLAYSSDGGQSIQWHMEVADTAASPFFMHPQMALEDGLAADFVYYAGTMDQDDNGSFRRSRVSLGVGITPSSVVEQPVTYLQARGDPRWLGDYVGVHWRAGQLYTSYVVNAIGVAQIAFAKYPAP